MRLQSFEVRGFKNFATPVTLHDLGPFVVLHGDNNVGKSNLLKAIELFTSLLSVALRDDVADKLPTDSPRELGDNEFEQWMGQKRVEIFPLGVETSSHMTLRGSLEAGERELRAAEAAALPDPTLARRVEIALELSWIPERKATQVRFTKLCGANGLDLARKGAHESDALHAVRLARIFGRTTFAQSGPRSTAMKRIRAERTDEATLRRMAETLHAARDSEDRAVASRWARFETTMAHFASVLGAGRFVPIWPQGKPATLMFETDRVRVPVHLLGSGVQQIVSVVADLLCSGAAIVAIEEPEVHLRTDAQELLREIIAGLPGQEGAPSQIIVSSHAPTFELAETFVHLHRDAAGNPVATRRPRSEASVALQIPTAGEELAPGAAAVSWLSSDGVLRLTDRVRRHIGREQAGGVVVSLSKGEERTAEIRSTEAFLERFGLGDDGENP